MNRSNLELCLYRYPQNFELTAGLVNALDSTQQQYLAGVSTKRQQQYCVGRLLLGEMLKRIYGIDPEHFYLLERQGLPPKLCPTDKGGSARAIPQFSISHSGDLVAVAMIRAANAPQGRLGLDIETVKQHRDIRSAEYFCTKSQLEELALLDNPGGQRKWLTRLWTQKEAYFKAYELPVLNPQLKQLNVTKSDLKWATLSTASIDTDTPISIYCTVPYTIKGRWLRMDGKGRFSEPADAKLQWHSYATEIVSA